MGNLKGRALVPWRGGPPTVARRPSWCPSKRLKCKLCYSSCMVRPACQESTTFIETVCDSQFRAGGLPEELQGRSGGREGRALSARTFTMAFHRKECTRQVSRLRTSPLNKCSRLWMQGCSRLAAGPGDWGGDSGPERESR